MCAYLIPKSFFDILRALKNSPRLVKRLLDENVENDLRLDQRCLYLMKIPLMKKDISIELIEQIFDI